ncbi:MAG: hypothetical protein KAS71_10410 [Bacteroidales bacterium]|nr:hypothetical protein [Bacteroidales bacterium]
MKRFVSVFVLVTVMFLGVNAQKLSKMAPKVVVIGIGEKNPTLNEAQFPNLNFYYTPDLVPATETGEGKSAVVSMSDGAKLTYNGSPEFLKTLWNDKDMDKAFMLFDKNGVCYTQGYDILRQNSDIGARGCVDKKPLSDHIKSCVKSEKVAKPGKKEMVLKKSDFLVGYKLPEFDLVGTDGESISIANVLNGEPTLVVFFNLPSNIDIQAAKESGKGKTGKAFAKSMLSGAAGGNIEKLYIELEAQVFEYDAREK